MKQNFETIMQRLGYTPAWIKAGVISESFLFKQWLVFLTSDDQSTEHYRHGAFMGFLNQQTDFSDALLEDLLALRDSDGFDMRVVRVHELLLSKRLSKQQRQDLVTRDKFQFVASIQKIYLRQCVVEVLNQEGLTPSVFAQIQQSQDQKLHELLLSRDDVSREHLLWLREHGQSKAIRNRVKQLLLQKRFRAV
jgi:hypothetical protein